VTSAPRVSILLPAYNAAGTLAESLASLREQTVRRWECIIVDDGSSDATGAIADSWAKKDPRFRVLRFPVRQGIVVALNSAADLAGAPYLARQDADDRSLPERLERSLALLDSDPALGAVACRVRIFPVEDLAAGMRAYEEWLNSTITPDEIAREIWVESPLPHPATIFRKEAFTRCGRYEDGPWPEDYDLWLRMHTAGWRFAKVAVVLYEWRHHANRLTFNDPRYSPAAFLNCKLRHLQQRLAGKPLLVWGAGRSGKRLARALLARNLQPRAFIDIDPKKIGSTRLGLPVISPEATQVQNRPTDPAPFILVAVGTKGARGLIRSRLHDMRRREPTDFLCLH
jgi:glycosyltransferase involved in cell wall biosynthesis